MQYLLIFFKLPAGKKRLIIEAFFVLGMSQAAIKTIKFKSMAAHWGEHLQESPYVINDKERSVVGNVSWAVNTMSRHTFWECKCLAQAVAAKYLLRRRNIKSTLYLGVARDEQQQMVAHAWLRSGDKIVTGARGKEGFVTLSYFGDTD